MKPKRVYTEQQRFDLVDAVTQRGQRLGKQAGLLGVSLRTAHRWLERYHHMGTRGLQTQSSRPHVQGRQLPEHLIACLVKWRRKTNWGPKKLLSKLPLGPDRRPPCSIRTLGRWLKRLSLSQKVRHRSLPGPTLLTHGLTLATKPNEVWTVDFKGWTRTGDLLRWEPLTVRDLYSRMGLAVCLLPNQSEAAVEPVMHRLFARYGLPKIIRVDNGTPFGSTGPMGLTALSLRWRLLGIEVEFIRRASPQENGSHEQFHRIYKAEVFCQSFPNRLALQRRSTAWLHHYNYQRPHEALGQKYPSQFYRPGRRRYHSKASPHSYPITWKTFKVTCRGYIRWKGRLRLITNIAAGLYVGLKPHRDGHCQVYANHILLGHLYPNDKAGMRPVKILRKMCHT